MQTVRRAVIAFSLLLATILVVPATSSAATYIDWECAGPSGAPTAARGFEAIESPSATATNTCGATGGSLSAGLSGPGPWQGGLSAAFRFNAPDDTRVNGVSIDRSTTGAANGGFLTYQINADNTLIDGCLPNACGADVSGTVNRSGLSAAQLTLTAGCGGVTINTCSFPIRLAAGRVGVALSDTIAPTVGNVRGSLFAPAAKSGTATVEFDSADRGGGVYRMVTSIDGKTVEIQPAAFGTCADIDPSNANPYEFPAKVPCPLTQAGLSVAIDTTKLERGAPQHQRRPRGRRRQRRRTSSGRRRRFTVRNARPNGSPAGRTKRGRVRMFFAANRENEYTTRIGRRVVTRGFLRDNRGRGIRGAEVEVYHYVAGRPRLLKTGLKSRRAGRLTLILPLNLFGDSRGRRRIAFYYRASVPGRVTSRANLYLTIRSRSGGPQTSQPR